MRENVSKFFSQFFSHDFVCFMTLWQNIETSKRENHLLFELFNTVHPPSEVLVDTASFRGLAYCWTTGGEALRMVGLWCHLLVNSNNALLIWKNKQLAISPSHSFWGPCCAEWVVLMAERQWWEKGSRQRQRQSLMSCWMLWGQVLLASEERFSVNNGRERVETEDYQRRKKKTREGKERKGQQF